MQRVIVAKVTALWDKTTSHSALRVTEKSFFFLLCVLEIFYRLGFLVIQKAKPFFFPPYQAPCRVIAVGNLSVGGTGKSVLVQFLIKNLSELCCAVVSRGYKRSKRYADQNLLVCDGKNIFYTADACGDEAFMLAKKTEVPVAVGSDRVESVRLLVNNARHNERGLDVIILDDAYQNEQLVKDTQILLLDARNPFENEHCLPAGRLREKDYTRADIIILTHADRVTSIQLHEIKKKLMSQKKEISIFSGMHQFAGFFQNNERVDISMLLDKPLLACAGIGSFSNFVQSLEQLQLHVAHRLQFSDHHHYMTTDLEKIVEHAQAYGCHGIVTTEKDWCKIKQLLQSNPQIHSLDWYVMRIEFEFLTQHEYHTFMKVIKNKLS